MRWLVVLVMGLTACGPRAFIDVAVQSSRGIPNEVDQLLVTVTDEVGNEVGRADYVPAGAFPQHVILEPSKATSATLDIVVEARLGGVPVASSGVRITWREDAINDVPVSLD